MNRKSKIFYTPLKIIGISLSILLIACSTTTVKSTKGNEPSLQELLQQEPAVNATQAYLINAALMRTAAPGISNLCLVLRDEDKQSAIQAEYALNSLAMYVTRTGAANERQEFLQGVYQALETDQLGERRPFLITLLKVAGDESSLKPLTKYLAADESLAALVIPTVLSIGTPSAGKELLSALPSVSGKNRIAIIQALGQLEFLPAADKIFEFTSDPDTSIRMAALSALANMGYEPLQPVLFKIIAENIPPFRDQLIVCYLQFINRLDNETKAAQYCREIIANLPVYYSEHNRLAALNILVDVLGGTPALPDVLNFMENGTAQDQLSVLPLLEKMDTGTVIKSVSAVKSSLPSFWQAEFISMLGTKKDQAAKSTITVPFIDMALQDTAEVVRAAAIKVILAFQPENADAVLVSIMRQDNDSLALGALYNGIRTIFTQGLMDRLVQHYAEMSLSSKQLLLNILGEHQVTKFTDFVITQLSAEQKILRITAIQNLPDLAASSDLPVLINLLPKFTGDEKEILSKSILSIIAKFQNEPVTNQTVAEYARRNDDSNRELLFSMLKQATGDSALKILRSEIKFAIPERKDLALRTLCEWPRINALDDLLNLVNSKEDLTYRILAARACVRLLQENDLGKEITFQYYRSIFDSAPRLEEKKMVLAAIAGVRSRRALNFLTTLTRDHDLGSNAIAAIDNLVRSTADSTLELKGVDVAYAFLAAFVPEIKDDSLNNHPPEGFVALFNGRDLTGWQGLVADPPTRSWMSVQELNQSQVKADEHMRQHWKVIDGVLCFDGQGENLCTIKNYRNFELLVDWKIEKNGDSGIYLRGSPQVQIWDPGNSGTGSGGLYNNLQGPSLPILYADRPVGEWNKFRIIMQGAKVTVYLNDQLVVDGIVLENYWQRDKPIYATGPIELQAHFNPLYFRNIFIRELEEESVGGNLLNGLDLTGWTIIDGDADSWQVKDSVLFTTGKDFGWISTDRTFSDFKLQLEFRLPTGGNSGIFIRTPRKGDPAYTGMEIQLLDDNAPQYADLKPWQYTGSIYGIQAPNQKASHPSGSWQQIEVECRGPQIKVTLNKVKIIDTNLIAHMDQEFVHPGIKRRSGYIGLQNHSTRVEFRKIRIQEIDF